MPRRAALTLALGLVAASQSGNLIRIADAHPMVIAGWRLVIAALAMLPIAGPHLGGLRAISTRLRLEAILAGLALGAHLVAWIAAVQRTTVANAATFFCINPLLTALAARFLLGEKVSPRLGVSIVLGLAGVLLMGIRDLRLSPDHLDGDLLAILCSALFTLYLLAGRRVRASMDNRVYVLVLYAVAGTGTLFLAALGDLDWLDREPRNWLAFGLLALIPTLLGHTFLNHALRWLPAARLSLLTLTEPAFAGIVAWWVWEEAIPWSTGIGYGLIALSVLFLLREGPGSPNAQGPRDGGTGGETGQGRSDLPIRLRGHHLGCAMGYTGHGYDAPFTENLARVASALREDPDRSIEVVEGPDDVCGPCPHRDRDTCVREPSSDSRVREHDRIFLATVGLRVGDRTSPREVEKQLEDDRQARKRILSACSSCPWTGVCAFHDRWSRR